MARPLTDDSDDALRVIPGNILGQTLLIGKFRSRTRATIARVVAIQTLELIGSSEDLLRVFGAGAMSSVVNMHLRTCVAATRKTQRLRDLQICMWRAPTPRETAGCGGHEVALQQKWPGRPLGPAQYDASASCVKSGGEQDLPRSIKGERDTDRKRKACSSLAATGPKKSH